MKIPYYTCLTFFENEKQKLKTKTTKSCFGFFVLKTIKQECVFSINSRDEDLLSHFGVSSSIPSNKNMLCQLKYHVTTT